MSTNGTNDTVSVVTGALGGMGMEIAMGLARRGGAVVLLGRDRARLDAAVEALRSGSGNPQVSGVPVDFSSLESVRQAAAAITGRHPTLHVLSHNAAVFASSRQTTADGHELMFGVNHLAPLLLTRLLVPALAPGARVIWNSGDWKNTIDFEDLQATKRWSTLEVFGRSKSANNLMAAELAERLADKKIAVHAVHPGFVKSTLVREAPLPLRIIFSLIGQSRHQGASWLLRAATEPSLAGQTGKFFVKAAERPFPAPAQDREARARLYRVSEQILGLG